jgi:hypothetical protein
MAPSIPVPLPVFVAKDHPAGTPVTVASPRHVNAQAIRLSCAGALGNVNATVVLAPPLRVFRWLVSSTIATSVSLNLFYAARAVYVSGPVKLTVSPDATTRPPLIVISCPEAATWQWITTVPADVSSVAVATGDALPAALVSDAIAFAVAVPDAAAPKAVAERFNVATIVPGAPTEPANLNLSFPDAPINAVTASQAALRAAALCVTAIVMLL